MTISNISIQDLNLLSFKGVVAKNDNEGTIYLVPSGAVFSDRLKKEKFKKVKISTTNKKLVYGDILFNSGGVGTLGRVGFFELNDGIYVPDSFVLVLRLKNDKILPKYIFYCLQTPEIKRQIIQKTSGTTGITSIKPKDVLTLKVPIPLDDKGEPSIIEQERIVILLEEAVELKKKREEVGRKIDMVVPALFNQMFGNVQANPKKWPVMKVSDLLVLCQYGTSKKSHENGKGVPVLRMNNVTSKGQFITEDIKYTEFSDDELQKYKLAEGDVLFNRTNSRELVGKTGVWDGRFQAVAASYFIRLRFDDKKLNPIHFGVLMNLPVMKKRLFEMARGAVGQSNINAKELGAISIPVPPIDLQNQFADKVKEINILETIQKKSSEKIESIFSSLISKI